MNNDYASIVQETLRTEANTLLFSAENISKLRSKVSKPIKKTDASLQCTLSVISHLYS